jgi:hypothetical protein
MKIFSKTMDDNVFYTNDTKTLSTLANEFQTDKGTADAKSLPWGNDYPKHSCWHYTKTYEKYMQSKKYDPISIMEIGVCDKRFPYASIKMWMSYFKHVDFYAVDNFWGYEIGDKMAEIEELNNSGVNFIYADQGSFTDWDELNNLYPNYFDFLVEDGSHWPNHMMVSLWKSIGIVKSGGYFFMEDIQNPLKSRGWFKYDNSLVAEELLQTLSTKKFYSSFLNDQQNKDIHDNFQLVDLILDPEEVNYLAVFKRK